MVPVTTVGLVICMLQMPHKWAKLWGVGEGRPAHPCHVESLRAAPPHPIVHVRSQFAQAQDELLSNLNSYPELEGSRFMQIVDGTVCRYQRAGDCAVVLPFAMMPTPKIRAKR